MEGAFHNSLRGFAFSMRKFAQCGPANDNDEAAVILTKKIEPSSAEE